MDSFRRRQTVAGVIVIVAAAAILAVAPRFLSAYRLSMFISVLMYAVLSTAWSFFSGATRYVSLATAGFFGAGAYVMALLGEEWAPGAVVLLAASIGFALALLVGLSTLRLSGMYFVIFTFGLTELIQQVVFCYEVNVSGTVGRFVYVDMDQRQIYAYLAGIFLAVIAASWFVSRTRLGLALRAIGEDETAANHLGINPTAVKVFAFAATGAVIAAVGAVLAPRWTYIDPSIVFNPLISFQVVIMALLGGPQRVYGPLLGAVPVVLLFEALSARFRYHFMIILGLCFVLTVYYLPDGIVGVLQRRLGGAGRSFASRGAAPPGGTA